MLRYLLDTDHLTLLQHRHQPLLQHLVVAPLADVGTSIVNVEEVLRGRLARVARARDGPSRILEYRDLLSSTHLFAQLPLVAYDQAAEGEFQQLLGLRLRVGSQDLKIAAIALA